MGHRMELYVPASIAHSIIDIANSFGIEAQIIGHCEEAASSKLTILSGFGEFIY
jgi:phosphoribosylformylglycinamidine cyclo-ligase